MRLVRPDGFYARGKARHNEGEARVIVAEIVGRLTHRDETVRRRSLGVVTFNSEQQTLIENLLDEARSRDPGIEWAFSRDSVLEPVFVKNLETVQGDERDVILFSVTYGPDQSGHVTMNFGPLNRDGGERRLNVAMTRARSEMLVFSTLSPDRIDLSRTQARAVADLKHFLEYAERGPLALGGAVFGSRGDFESPFEISVSRALRDKGWEVHPQVGVSAYRIDLGILHPDQPGVYLAGVECDGAMYHSASYARERDKIRQAVLEGLGWTLFRVWSTDWWTNRAKALDALHQSFARHLEEDRRKRKEAEEAKEAEKTSPPSVPPRPTEDEPEVEMERAAALPAVLSPSTLAPNEDLFGDTTHSYVIAPLDGGLHQADPNLFYAEEYAPRLSAMIDHVIDIEGPIHEEVLVRRIARHHGFQRAGRQIRDIVVNLAKHRRGRTREDVGLFFWPKGTVKERLAPARYRDRDDEMRNVEHICQEEIRAINAALGLNHDPVEIARGIGIARLSQGARMRISKAMTGDLEG